MKKNKYRINTNRDPDCTIKIFTNINIKILHFVYSYIIFFRSTVVLFAEFLIFHQRFIYHMFSCFHLFIRYKVVLFFKIVIKIINKKKCIFVLILCLVQLSLKNYKN